MSSFDAHQQGEMGLILADRLAPHDNLIRQLQGRVMALDPANSPPTVTALPNLIGNGDFPVDTSGYVSGAGGSLNPGTSITRVADTGAGSQFVGEIVLPATIFSGYGYAFTATAGVPLVAQIKVKSMSGTTNITADITATATLTGGGTFTTAITPAYATYTVSFIPSVTGSHTLRFFNNAAAAGTFRIGGIFVGTRIPTNGQTIDFLADAASGVVWRFKYRAASASAYKWEFVGGAPLLAQDPGTVTTTSTTPVTLSANSVSLTVPLAGDYMVGHGFIGALFGAAPGGSSLALLYINGATSGMGAQTGNAVNQTADGAYFDTASSISRVNIPAGVVADQRYRQYPSAGPGTAYFSLRYLMLTPVRVG